MAGCLQWRLFFPPLPSLGPEVYALHCVVCDFANFGYGLGVEIVVGYAYACHAASVSRGEDAQGSKYRVVCLEYISWVLFFVW